MKGNNILGAIFLSIVGVAYVLSAHSYPDNYDDFCKIVECPNQENLSFDPHPIYEKAKITAYVGGFSFIGLVWLGFYLYDRYHGNKKPLYNSDGVLIDGSES